MNVFLWPNFSCIQLTELQMRTTRLIRFETFNPNTCIVSFGCKGSHFGSGSRLRLHRNIKKMGQIRDVLIISIFVIFCG